MKTLRAIFAIVLVAASFYFAPTKARAVNFCGTGYSINQCLNQIFSQAGAAPNFCTTQYSTNQCLNQISNGGAPIGITAGVTPATGFTSGDLLSNNGSVVTDSGIHVVATPLLSGGNMLLQGEIYTAYTGTESFAAGIRAFGNVATGNNNTAVGHDSTGIGSGCPNIFVSNSTTIGNDSARNTCGMLEVTVGGVAAFRNYAQAGNSGNHFAWGSVCWGANCLLNWNSATDFPWNSALGDSACSGAAGNQSFVKISCVGSNSGANLTTANTGLLLAGGGNGVHTCSSCARIIDILSGAHTSTLSATATDAVNIENIIGIINTGTPSTSTTSIAGNFSIAGTQQFASSITGAGLQTFTNSPCGTLNTERWIPITINGQTGTWNVPACQ